MRFKRFDKQIACLNNIDFSACVNGAGVNGAGFNGAGFNGARS